MDVLLLGSIGVLAETSDLQRAAYNDAFASHGVPWHWSREAYAGLLSQSGGLKRLQREARRLGQSIDAEAVHAEKSKLFQQRLAEGVPLRPGVAEAMHDMRASGGRIGLVTTTSPSNVDAILDAVGLKRGTFDVVIDGPQVSAGKPDPEAYLLALERLRVRPEAALAVEDNPQGFAAAIAARLRTLAFPGALHRTSSFPGAPEKLQRLDLGERDRAA
ncbi:MAG: HAD-IA family hydrolase [Pseudomonadota bacterium]